MINRKNKQSGNNILDAQNECVVQILNKKLNIEDEMMKVVRSVCRQYKVNCQDLKKSNLLESYNKLVDDKKVLPNLRFEEMIRKRKIRTASGVSVISVMTKPLGCPGKCVYCPNQNNMPKSYLDNQPAAMRGVMNDFDPFDQVVSRLTMLKKMGHDVSKNEVIILGGTFSAHPIRYQELFVKRIFDAFNYFGESNEDDCIKNIADNLVLAKKINETTSCRMIGLTIETRPDYINLNELKWLRYLGVTRVELGVQTTNDEILEKIKRGHNSEEIKKATKLLRQAGFKIVYHVMPGLPGSTIEQDVLMFEKLFSDKGFFPDHLKIYPTVVLHDSELYEWWKKGDYKPYNLDETVEVLSHIKRKVPKWVRIVRVMRDIPEESVVDGPRSSNLRQLIKMRGVECRCIRCREPFGKVNSEYKIDVKKYTVDGGEEVFISAESVDEKNIFALVRLFLPEKNEVQKVITEIDGCALIRELHTYGVVAGINEKGEKVQHQGLGKKLMSEAEKIAIDHEFGKMAVIAGVGVRAYYQKIDYVRQGEYMVKNLL